MKAVYRWLLIPLTASAAAAPASAQIGSALAQTVSFPVAPVPFGPGESQNYKVEWGVFGSVGEGALEVVGVDTIHGNPSYHLNFRMKGGILFAKVDDEMQSWLDVQQLFTRRFDQKQHEVNYKRHKIFDFDFDRMEWIREDNDEFGPLASAEPLDEVSFLYFVRTLPLVVGETYTFDRYFKAEGNPVTVKVLRKDSLTIGKDTYHTIVVQPIIKTKGIFSEGGEAEVHFTDDDRRLIVHLRAKMSIGTLKMWLQSYTPGRQLVPAVPESSSASR
jgi:Protein of unknown function (DUF3108)